MGDRAVTTIALAERGGKTTLTFTIRHIWKEVRDAALKFPMAEGIAAGYDQLDELPLNAPERETRRKQP